MLDSEVSLSVCFVGSGTGLVDWRRCSFVKNRENSGPGGISRLLQWESTNADNIETTEPISKLCIYDRTDRRGPRNLIPGLLGLTLYPSSQVLFISRGVVWVQSVLDSTRLCDERAKPDGSDHKGQPSRIGCSSIHEGQLSWSKK